MQPRFAIIVLLSLTATLGCGLERFEDEDRAEVIAYVAGLQSSGDVVASEDVVLDQGTVIGAREGVVDIYPGIPYADPPERWRRPTPVTPQAGIANRAPTLDMFCAQYVSELALSLGSEDCLYLNVFAPATAPASAKPVMVWIHGGGLGVGSSYEEVYNGTSLANYGDVVVVTINYRVGTLGFLAHEELTAEDGKVSGNYGAHDQVEALRWVQRNIAAFGGDPNNVTIFGQSAGAHSVNTLVLSPLGRGLFHKVIAQSAETFTFPLNAAEEYGARLAALVGCDGAEPIACMRELPVETIDAGFAALTEELGLVDAITADNFSANPRVAKVGGDLLPSPPAELIASGDYNVVPMIMGATKEEGYSKWVGYKIFTVPFIRRQLRSLGLTGAQIDALLLHYQLTYLEKGIETGHSDYWFHGALTTDLFLNCPQRQMLRLLDAQQSEPVFRYVFDHYKGKTASPGSHPFADHSADLPYTLLNFPSGYDPQGTTLEGDLSVASQMIRYWTNFARTGDPNVGAEVPNWPAYELGTERHLRISASPRVEGRLHNTECDAIGDVFY